MQAIDHQVIQVYNLALVKLRLVILHFLILLELVMRPVIVVTDMLR